MKIFKAIGPMLGVLAIVFGTWFFMDDRWAKCADVKKVEQKVDLALDSIQLEAIDRRIWVIKERHGEKPKAKTVKEELDKLEKSKAFIENKMMEKK